MSDLKKALEDAYDASEGSNEVEDNSDIEVEESIEELEASEENIETSEDKEAEVEAEGEQEPELEVSEEVEAVEEEEEPLNPPQFWKEAQKQAFNQLPRDIKEEILRADKETQGYVTKLSQEASVLRNTVGTLNQTIEPYRDIIMQDGGDPVAYINKLFYWDSNIRNNPVEGIKHLMHINGVDINQLTSEQQYVDPYVKQQEERINSLEQMLKEQEKQKQQEVMSSLEAEVEAFANEMGEDGSLLRPHLQDERVIRDMINLTPGVRNGNPNSNNQEILQKAYNLATYNLGLSQPKPVAKQPEKKPVSIKEAKKKVSSSVTGSGTGKSPKAKAKDTRSAIELSMQQLGY